ncbi:nuclear transport factor 2 family protein [Rhodopseudomonas pseudopalustris]|uniref:Uncharacterized protein n=2 Tax=Rhodopseudomonas TaxID=1073 RepID=Q130E8_RHOPS|nr:nuclear transport factor 2 family protein [Rhodopseudomonas pseudopalustris]ABE41541.1 hypothetical protein RPD_4324 [Rhodopseudomonas palustris BisB5]SEO10285.1 SnoaL-like domain-containing protein [Rhodopseudomonas pseudopalustris]
MTDEATHRQTELVERYFDYVRELRAGKEEAVDKLVELWDEDGTFEFAGAPPVVGTFKGRNAIHALYKNRVNACDMPLHLSGAEKAEDKTARGVALGLVDTRINRVRSLEKEKDDKVVVGWTTVIGTNDKQGFQVSGNHTFKFKSGRIASLEVAVSPKAELSEGFRLEGLAVDDIGRLSLAAWCVV